MERLDTADWVEVFDLFTGGRIPREAIQPVAAHVAENPGVDAVRPRSLGYAMEDRAAWAEELAGLAAEDYRVNGRHYDEKRLRYFVGEAVRLLRGRAPAKEVAESVKSQLQQEVLQ